MTEDSLFEFPCSFPLKVMGRNEPHFEQFVVEVVRTHAGSAALEDVSSRASRNARYLAVTVTFQAENRTTVDDIYLALTSSGQVLFPL